MESVFHVFTPTLVPIMLISFNYTVDDRTITIKYPALFAGCGDGICMPLRGEKCYVRQCPECGERNINKQIGVGKYYPKYNIERCFCPPYNPENDWESLVNCSNEVRDIFGCVIIKGINERAKKECQCLWTEYYDYSYDLVLTDRYYCCPENAQIAFSYGINIIDNIILEIPGSSCGNLTVQLRRVASKGVYGPYNVDLRAAIGGLPVVDCVVDI